VKVVAETLGVPRSNLHARLNGSAKPRRRYHKAQDGERVNATGSREPANVLPLITAFVAARPTYGYRRITALLNRQLQAQGTGPVNHKRVYRIMKAPNLLLARRYTDRPELTHEGKVVTMRSNIRSPAGLNQWRLTGSLFRWLRVHLLERGRHLWRLHHRRARS
jgi:hypothetical protein